MLQLNAHLTREYKFELESFELDKRLANLICDMGFVIQDMPKEAKMHRLIKKTANHLILVKYEIRDRIVDPPNPEDSPELI